MTVSGEDYRQMTTENMFDHTSGRYVSCGAAQIYVEEKGNPELPLLIMLHGGFGTIEDFNTIAPALTHKFKLIGIDSRGHGKSSLGAAKLSYQLLADDLAQIIDSLELSAFNLFGFSDGGITSYRYATRKDPRLGNIITVGARWEMSKNDPAWAMLSGMRGDIWKQAFPLSYESYMRLNPEPDFDEFSKAVVAMWTDLSSAGHPGALMKQIDNEILAIRGEKDPLTSLESMERLRGLGKKVRLVNIPFAEHVAFHDDPEMFLRTVSCFHTSSERETV